MKRKEQIKNAYRTTGDHANFYDGMMTCSTLPGMAAWVGLVGKGMLPVKKIALVCNPVFIALLGQLMNLIMEGLGSGFESFGWLLMYLVCAMKLVGKEERV